MTLQTSISIEIQVNLDLKPEVSAAFDKGLQDFLCKGKTYH